MAYRERLKNWESREDKRRKEYQIEKKKEIQRKKLLQKEAKKLRQFLEDYDDEKDDSIHYKGSSLEKKLKSREKEIESDNKDRLKEKEELEELKKKLIDKGLSDVEIEAQRVIFIFKLLILFKSKLFNLLLKNRYKMMKISN
jgi:RNA-binding protein 25